MGLYLLRQNSIKFLWIRFILFLIAFYILNNKSILGSLLESLSLIIISISRRLMQEKSFYRLLLMSSKINKKVLILY
jgi:hypothetical protein